MWAEEDLLSAERSSRRRSPSPDYNRRSYRNERRNRDEVLPELYSIHQGRVAAIKDFGAFIQLQHFLTQGLLHKSHISKEPIQDINNIISIDEIIWVKVVNIDTDGERPRYGVSMRLASQRDGSDLDPNNVELMLCERKRKSFQDYEKKLVTLDAVLPTICSKCGSAGHLDFECYAANKEGKTYELIDEQSIDALIATSERIKEPHKKSHKSHKKRRQKLSDISEITSKEEAMKILDEIDRKKRRKKEKKREKKEKSKSHRSSKEKRRREYSPDESELRRTKRARY